MNKDTQVFLSYKCHGNNNELLPDYYMAKEVYDRLYAEKINVFFSDETLKMLASSDYKKAIDEALDKAQILIVVSTSSDNCDSSWVRYEWDSFYSDILSGTKKGEMLSYLDSNDIASFPRTIRHLQVFKKDEIDSLISFVISYFEKDIDTSDVQKAKGSSYNYNGKYYLGDEKKRLEIQANIESQKDSSNIEEILSDYNGEYNILDIGCSNGSVTFDVFSKYKNAKILGIDKYDHCVEEFNSSLLKHCWAAAETIDLEEDDWEEKLSCFMLKNNINKFDLVYCALSLHHLSNSEDVIKKIWKYIKIDGYIYIRTCDDSLKIAYPNDQLVKNIIEISAKVPRISDRYHGRKVYSMLYKSKYRNINIKSFLIDTCNKNINQRYALFYSAFVWRKNYFENRLEEAKTKEESDIAMKEYNEIIGLLDKVEDLFSDYSFYFGYYVTIAIAQKQIIL